MASTVPPPTAAVVAVVELITGSYPPPMLLLSVRFVFNKPLNPKFILSHSVLMRPIEIPSQNLKPIKIPSAQYEFGANFLDPKMLCIGKLTTDGRLTVRLKCDLTGDLSLKANAQLTNEPDVSQGMATSDYKKMDVAVSIGKVANVDRGGLEMRMLLRINKDQVGLVFNNGVSQCWSS